MALFCNGLPAPGIELAFEGLVLGLELCLSLFAAQELLDGIGLQGALDEGVAHIEELVAAEAVLLIAQSHALQAVLGHIAPVDGEIIGSGGELDVARLAVFFGVEQPEGRDLVDLFDGNFVHKASPLAIIAQFSQEGKCFSPTDNTSLYVLPPTIFPAADGPAVILSDRRESKDLRIYHYTCSKIGAKILRLRASPCAQDDMIGGGWKFPNFFRFCSKFHGLAAPIMRHIRPREKGGCAI